MGLFCWFLVLLEHAAEHGPRAIIFITSLVSIVFTAKKNAAKKWNKSNNVKNYQNRLYFLARVRTRNNKRDWLMVVMVLKIVSF